MTHTHGLTRLRFVLITVSDSRTIDTDVSGKVMETQVTHAGHDIVYRAIIPDEPTQITQLITDFVDKTDVICLSGGTGISQRDRTYEAVVSLLDKILSGFGELFRMLSYEEIGAAAMLSRAIGGIYCNTVIFSLPGSPNAVRLALDKLILPQVTHLTAELKKHQ